MKNVSNAVKVVLTIMCLFLPEFISIAHTNSNGVVRTYRKNLGYGYADVQEMSNGNRLEAWYFPCGMCGGSQRCQICQGRGGMVTAGYGTYIPCYSCQQTGKCTLCSKNDGYVLNSSHLYDSNGKEIFIGSHAGNMGGGGYSGANSGSGHDNSSRYGYYTCPTCYGSGKCQTCGGDGIADSYYTGGSMVCPNCRSNVGKCSVCGGTGQKYGVK